MASPGNNLSCTLDVGSQQAKVSEVSIQFSLDVNPVQNRPRIMDASDKKLMFKEQEFELDMFETTSYIHFNNYFMGQPLTFTLNYLDQDLLNNSISFKQKLTSVTEFSKLIRCSRINTRILDFMISSSTSFSGSRAFKPISGGATPMPRRVGPWQGAQCCV